MTAFNFSSEPIRECELPDRQIDARLATPEMNFGSRGKAREINAIYEDSTSSHVIWQPDVYAEARVIAERFGITRIMDVGCGNGEKLVHYFPSTQFETVGLDFHGSLILARSGHPAAKWVETDLNSVWDLTTAFKQVNSDEPVLLILSDVIEHLPDPRLLLAQLRSVLLSHPENRLILSTPDRIRLNYPSYGSYPENKAHVREWTHDELAKFCISAGFQVERYGHTRANQYDEVYSTIFLQLRCEPTLYAAFLLELGLQYADGAPTHLLITSEYAGLHGTGGIGTFVAEQRLSYGVENTLCLFLGEADSPDPALFAKYHLLQPKLMVADGDISLPMEDVALKATIQLLFYFPNIAKIEYADYQGLGCRLAQAARAGMFPPSVELIVYCHGATHYLENANQTWYGRSHFNAAEREKISIENADRIVFPTKFLRDLYCESGFDMVEAKIVQLRYPFHFEHLDLGATASADTIVFFGKRSTMKGYSLFLGALAADHGYLAGLGVKKIVFIGPVVVDRQEDVALLHRLRNEFEVIEFVDLGRDAAIEKLRSYASNAICVMPYLGDNHPYAMLDVTFSGLLPLMLRAGGVAELIPEPFDKVLLADPNEHALLQSIRALVKLPVAERHRLRINYLERMESIQSEINAAVRLAGISRSSPAVRPPSCEATVIVPVFNTDRRFISELVFGLNCQSTSPLEVIFVDDASERGYAHALGEQLRAELRLPFRIISHSVNKGLAAARNTGLSAVTTPYVINVDSDDVPRTDFVRNIVRRLDAEPRCSAAVPYLKAFDEHADFNEQVFGGYVYRPLGDGVVASQLDNNLGHANSGYRTSVIRELGGWDDSEKSMWEDWALFLKLASSGHRIGIIPQTDCLYRVRQNSMLRTYKVWPAMRRLARNMNGLPRYENFRLQALVRHAREEEGAMLSELAGLRSERLAMRSELVRICNEHAALSEEVNRRSARFTRKIVAKVVKYPRLYSVLQSAGIRVWKVGRRIRNLTVTK